MRVINTLGLQENSSEVSLKRVGPDTTTARQKAKVVSSEVATSSTTAKTMEALLGVCSERLCVKNWGVFKLFGRPSYSLKRLAQMNG